MNLTEAKTALIGKSNRRSFLRKAIGLGAGAAALPAAMTLATPSAHADDAANLAEDLKVLTLALNLEYLEAEFYTYAVFGTGIETKGVGITGTTAPGTTLVKPNPQVAFATDTILQYAQEIAQDEQNHVNAIRTLFGAAGMTPPSRPNIDLFNSFNTLAQAAGIGASFDPFADEVSFLLGAFIFEDVGVTAYRGGAPHITNPDYLGDAAGILAVEAIHAGLVRLNLLGIGGDALTIVQKISDLRDSLDHGGDKDQGLSDPYGRSIGNIVPTNVNAQVFIRSARQVLNIVYGAKNASSGLFFPNGINM